MLACSVSNRFWRQKSQAQWKIKWKINKIELYQWGYTEKIEKNINKNYTILLGYYRKKNKKLI